MSNKNDLHFVAPGEMVITKEQQEQLNKLPDYHYHDHTRTHTLVDTTDWLALSFRRFMIRAILWGVGVSIYAALWITLPQETAILHAALLVIFIMAGIMYLLNRWSEDIANGD